MAPTVLGLAIVTDEVAILVCSSCRKPMGRARVCPTCIRQTCGRCLTVGGCRKCAPARPRPAAVELEAEPEEESEEPEEVSA